MTRFVYSLSMVLKRNQERVQTVHKSDCLHCTRISAHLRSFTCGRTLSGSLSKGVLSDARQPEVRRIFFNMLWRCQVWNAKGVFSHTDDLSEILSKSTAQECKRCTSGWLASLKSLPTVNPWTDFKCGQSLRLIYAVSLRVLLFIHFLFWKFGKRIIAQVTHDIFQKDLRVHVYSADATTEGIACSKRSDGGEWCEVKKAMKSRGRTGERGAGTLSHLSPSLAFIFSRSLLHRTAPHYLNAWNRLQKERVYIVKLHSEWVWLWHGALGLQYLCADMG